MEGIPVVIMEAMAAEMPVVSTYYSGIPEIVEDGVTGYLVPERDTVALTEKLGMLAGNRDLRIAMGSKGRGKVAAEYNMEKLNRELFAIFKDLLKQ